MNPFRLKKILLSIAGMIFFVVVTAIIFFPHPVLSPKNISVKDPSIVVSAKKTEVVSLPSPSLSVRVSIPGEVIPPIKREPLPPSLPSSLKWGFYTEGNIQGILSLEQTLGKSPDLIATFVHFGNENQFPLTLAPVTKDRGKTLVIFWEATDYNVGEIDQPKFSSDAFLRGDWDIYMEAFASDAKKYGAPVILIPFSEMNGDWYPWSGTVNGNTPEKVILAYRHIHDIFVDVPNVKFGWAINNGSFPDTPENSMNTYYPGDAYVDYVGVDGFDFGSVRETFDQMFSESLGILVTYNKPIYIFSFATGDGADKASWVTETFTKDILKYPKIEGWIWFNEKKERDWRMNSDENSLEAFKTILP